MKILFLCTGNSCRSQMAEGLCRAIWSDRFDCYSAGIEQHGMNPLAVKVMAEIGIDISGHSSKTLDQLGELKFDLVVSVCDHAAESCPVFPGNVKRVHRSFEDPPRLARDADNEAQALPHYRRVRDDIRSWLRSTGELTG